MLLKILTLYPIIYYPENRLFILTTYYGFWFEKNC
jgi:hypothetical protein